MGSLSALKSKVEALGFAATLAVAVLMIFSPLFAVAPVASSSSGQDRMGLKGDVKVYVDGVLVREQHNVISYFHYDGIMCKVYNSSVGCGAAGYTNTTDNKALNVIGLSTSSATDTSTTATACTGYISGSNLDGKVATLSYVAHANSISMTASWVANASVTNIQKACLFASIGSTVYASDSFAAYAATHFTAININNGQSIAITWTFSY